MADSTVSPRDDASPALQNNADPAHAAVANFNADPDGDPRATTPPPPGLPPVLSPPYWQVHRRHTSTASVASTITRPPPIRLEDNTTLYAPDGTLNDLNSHPAGSLASSVSSPPARSPLWARVVRIEGHILVAGAVRGVGDYVVWTCAVDTLDGGTIVLRKRYSEFVALRGELQTTFPNSTGSLPALPPKSVLRRFQPNFLEKRRAGLEFFLNCILLNPEFASSALLKEFVFS